jgi:hypothetical protein
MYILHGNIKYNENFRFSLRTHPELVSLICFVFYQLIHTSYSCNFLYQIWINTNIHFWNNHITVGFPKLQKQNKYTMFEKQIIDIRVKSSE